MMVVKTKMVDYSMVVVFLTTLLYNLSVSVLTTLEFSSKTYSPIQHHPTGTIYVWAVTQ